MRGTIVDRFVALQLRDCGRRLTNKVMHGAEDSLGLTLPNDYRCFLEVFNGGRFYPRWHGTEFPLRFAGGNHLPAIFDGIGLFTFFSINEPLNWRDLMWNTRAHARRIREGSVPIGSSGNSLLLMDCAGSYSIGLWTRDVEGTIGPEDNWIPLANSFSEFAAGIRILSPLERLEEVEADFEPYISIEAHDLQGLRDWVSDNGPLADMPDRGLELLKAACAAENFDGAQWLLSQGVDTTDAVMKSEKAPIEFADEAGCGDIVVLLLEYGANTDDLYRDSRNPQELIVAFVSQWQAGQRKSRRTG